MYTGHAAARSTILIWVSDSHISFKVVGQSRASKTTFSISAQGLASPTPNCSASGSFDRPPYQVANCNSVSVRVVPSRLSSVGPLEAHLSQSLSPQMLFRELLRGGGRYAQAAGIAVFQFQSNMWSYILLANGALTIASLKWIVSHCRRRVQLTSPGVNRIDPKISFHTNTQSLRQQMRSAKISRFRLRLRTVYQQRPVGES